MGGWGKWKDYLTEFEESLKWPLSGGKSWLIVSLEIQKFVVQSTSTFRLFLHDIMTIVLNKDSALTSTAVWEFVRWFLAYYRGCGCFYYVCVCGGGAGRNAVYPEVHEIFLLKG